MRPLAAIGNRDDDRRAARGRRGAWSSVWEIACRRWSTSRSILFPKPSDIAASARQRLAVACCAPCGMTLRITLQAFVAAVVIGTLIAFMFVQSRAIETQLVSLRGAAAGDADRRDRAADHHPGEEHPGRADHLRDRGGAVSDHLQHHARAAQRRSRARQPVPHEPGRAAADAARACASRARCRISSAGLRISSGLALIGAVVAEFVAGTGGRSVRARLRDPAERASPSIFRACSRRCSSSRSPVSRCSRSWSALSKLALGELARKRNRSRDMTTLLIRGAEGIFTGLPGAAMRTQRLDPHRATGGSRRSANSNAEPGETGHRCDGLRDLSRPRSRPITTCSRASSRACDPASTCPLVGWLRAVPYAYWHKIDEEALARRRPHRARRTAAVGDHDGGRSPLPVQRQLPLRSRPHVIFEVARESRHPAGVLPRRRDARRAASTRPISFRCRSSRSTACCKSVEACAQRYHDPSPDSMCRVAFAPTTPPWSLASRRARR